MSPLALGALLAVAASVALNASYVLQHAGSVGTAAISARRPLATMRALLASRAWLLGGALGLAGWGLHVGALAHAPLSIVQAFVAGGLALTVPMASLGLGHRVSAPERRAAALLVGARVLLSVGLHGEGRHAHPDPVALAACAGALVAGAGLLAALVRGPGRAAALALAGGALYGAADLAIKALTGDPRPLASPWLLVAALATTGAFFSFQRGLQLGRPVTAIALMTAATNVTSIGCAFIAFGDPLGRTPALAAIHALAFSLVALGAWWLAPAQAAHLGVMGNNAPRHD
ncbi:MAG: hypothetical protein ACXVFT_13120 [Solirubrobacteraceae bacterium]